MQSFFAFQDDQGNITTESLPPLDLRSSKAFLALAAKHGEPLAEALSRTAYLANKVVFTIGVLISDELLCIVTEPVFPERLKKAIDGILSTPPWDLISEPAELKVIISPAEDVRIEDVAILEESIISCIIKIFGNRYPLRLYLAQVHGLVLLTQEVETAEIARIMADLFKANQPKG